MQKHIEHIEKVFSAGFHRTISLAEKRPNLYQLKAPFFYPDGDMMEVFLRVLPDNSLVVEDLGMALMRLSYQFSLDSKNKQKIFREILNAYCVEEKDGNIFIKSDVEELFSKTMQLIQVINKVSDISFLKRETVKTMFYEYFENFLFQDLRKHQPIRDYYPSFDEKKKQYPSPFALLRKGRDPICLFPISSDEKCKDATITIQQYELHGFKPETIAVFENQEDIGRKPLAHLSNVVGKQFSTLEGNEGRILEYAEKLIAV